MYQTNKFRFIKNIIFILFSLFSINLYSSEGQIGVNGAYDQYMDIKHMSNLQTCLNLVTDATCWNERCYLSFCQKNNSINEGSSSTSYSSLETGPPCSPQMNDLIQCDIKAIKAKKQREQQKKYEAEVKKYWQEKKEYEMSQACPKNMTKRWDETQGKKVCLCLYPFLKGPTGNCITAIQAYELLPKCKNGQIPFWHDKKQEYICQCQSNKPWWNVLGKCTTWNEQAMYCQKFQAIVIGSGSNAYCDCTNGTTWASGMNQCADQYQISVFCDQQFPGSVPLWDYQNNNQACGCPKGTQKKNNRCINKVVKPTHSPPKPESNGKTCKGHTIYCKWNTSGIGKYFIKIKNNSAIDINKDKICDLCGLSTKGIPFISHTAGGCKNHNWDPN